MVKKNSKLKRKLSLKINDDDYNNEYYIFDDYWNDDESYCTSTKNISTKKKTQQRKKQKHHNCANRYTRSLAITTKNENINVIAHDVKARTDDILIERSKPYNGNDDNDDNITLTYNHVYICLEQSLYVNEGQAVIVQQSDIEVPKSLLLIDVTKFNYEKLIQKSQEDFQLAQSLIENNNFHNINNNSSFEMTTNLFGLFLSLLFLVQQNPQAYLSSVQIVLDFIGSERGYCALLQVFCDSKTKTSNNTFNTFNELNVASALMTISRISLWLKSESIFPRLQEKLNNFVDNVKLDSIIESL